MTHRPLVFHRRWPSVIALLLGLAGGLAVLEASAAPPAPALPPTNSATRFTDNGNGTVTDNLTGLIWLKNANCFSIKNWNAALSDANGLASPACGLTDGSSVGAWRLPNRNELESLIDYGRHGPALPQGHPFAGVQSASYWSSSTSAPDPARAWHVRFSDGYANHNDKPAIYFVWPVRGGQ